MRNHFLHTIFLLCSVSLLAANDPSALCFHFNFDRANGSNEVTDLTGKHHCNANAPLLIEGGGLHLDYGAKITIPASSVPDTSKNFTLSAWIAYSKRTAHGLQLYHPIVSKGFFDKGMEFALSLQDQLPTIFYNGATTQALTGINVIGHVYGATTRYPEKNWIKSAPEVAEFEWTNLAIVSQDGRLSIYRNGVLAVEAHVAKPMKPTKAPLYIGAERIQDESDNRVSAHILLNDLRMYSEALDESEIQKIYNSEKSKYAKATLFNPTNRYWSEDMKEFSYDLDSKLQIVQEYEKSLPTDPYASQPNIASTVGKGSDIGNLIINGEKYFPFSGYPNIGYAGDQSVLQATRFTRDFAAAGVDLVTVSFSRPIFWIAETEFRWDEVDASFKKLIEANPKVKILASFYLTPPPWFVEKYPDELEQYYYNDDDLSAGLRKWGNSAPLASKKWADLSCSAVDAFVRHVESQPYANHVYGYLVPSGDAGEWYWPAAFTGGMSGYSTPTRDGFRAWLKAKYVDNRSLQNAWKDNTVTLESALSPPPAERKATERWVFRDRAKAQKIFDFRAYLGDTTFSLLERTINTAKEANGGNKIVTTYYGYPLLYAGKGSTLQKVGIQDLGRVLSLKTLDILTTPLDYVRRRGGEPGTNINGFTGSARLHNKQIWREEDLRTQFWPRFEFGRMATSKESVNVITRDFGHSLTNQGSGLWFMAMAGNAAFHSNTMMERFRQLAQAGTKSLSQDRKSVAEVALIFDEKSLIHLAVQTNNFIDAHCWGTYESAAMMGAPFDLYLLDDIDSMPDYKLYVFLNSYELPPEKMQKIKAKVRKNNAVSVWCYAPGYISPQGFQSAGMRDITDIGLKEDLREIKARFEPAKVKHPIIKYATPSQPYRLGPTFEVQDTDATILGTVGGRPSFAFKEHTGENPAESWRSVYSLTPLTKELLRGLCEYSDVHVYSDSFDVLAVNKSYLMLHSTHDGEKVFRLPGTFNVYDALTQDLVKKDTTMFSQPINAKETRIFRISPSNDKEQSK